MPSNTTPDTHEIISIYTDEIIGRTSMYTGAKDPLESFHAYNHSYLCTTAEYCR